MSGHNQALLKPLSRSPLKSGRDVGVGGGMVSGVMHSAEEGVLVGVKVGALEWERWMSG